VAASACDAAIFVSQPLARLCAADLDGKAATIIPCTASEDRFFYDPALRSAQRAELGYSDDDKVVVYCGSVSTFEYFEESAAYVARAAAANERLRFLVVTPQVDTASHQLAGYGLVGATVVRADFADVNRYLNAADAGLLLRRRNPVTESASPTKFAEYCLTGLPVIMHDYIGDTFDIARSLGLYISPDAALSGLPPPVGRAAAAAKARDRLGKAGNAIAYEEAYGSALCRSRGDR
jgi:hypothetical protein